MNILLVCPEHPVTFWSFKYALKFANKKANLPPLGILTVAAMLPKEWSLKLVDMNTKRLRDKDIIWADLVFISAMNIQKDSAEAVIKKCKDFGVKTACGGPLFSCEPQNYDDVDYLLLYEGEICIPEFIKDLEANTPKHIYDFQEYPELTQTPAPLWELLDLNTYAMLSIQYSRGCPFHCDFCNVVSLFGHSPRTKTVGQIIFELEKIYNTGWRGSIFFVDDNFIGNKKKLKSELLPTIINWMESKGYPFTFFTEASINLADDDELMSLMTAAGFDNVFIGIESVDEDSLEECMKVQNTNRDLVGCVKKIQQHGMQVQGGFILGFDSDKPSIFSRMISFIQDSGIVTAMVVILNAPPGTKLFERMKMEGRLLKDFSGANADANFVTKMNSDDLRDGYHKVLNSIYSPKNYYDRIKIFLENFHPEKHRRRKFSFGDVGAFFKACFHLGIADRAGRKDYWELLRWSFQKKKGTFSMAVIFSVYGYHFRKCLPTALFK